ncbi:unnamed protein product [Thlaspi arvense]|uniref:Uncharacterized protein n=1 Tax=Thlaspi arvense TaxID=13288 RepID=A0AAU9S437_THLAR|nr:unnamed protein product [Thlaspi arvense]
MVDRTDQTNEKSYRFFRRPGFPFMDRNTPLGFGPGSERLLSRALSNHPVAMAVAVAKKLLSQSPLAIVPKSLPIFSYIPSTLCVSHISTTVAASALTTCTSGRSKKKKVKQKNRAAASAAEVAVKKRRAQIGSSMRSPFYGTETAVPPISRLCLVKSWRSSLRCRFAPSSTVRLGPPVTPLQSNGAPMRERRCLTEPRHGSVVVEMNKCY